MWKSEEKAGGGYKTKNVEGQNKLEGPCYTRLTAGNLVDDDEKANVIKI